MANLITRLAKNTGIYLVGNIINRLGAFILLPLYTNYLTIEQYGGLELIYSTTSILAVLFGAGLSHATLRFYFDFEEEEERNKVVITNFCTSLLLSCAGIALLFFWSKPIAFWLFDSYEAVILIYFAMGIIVLELSSEIFFAYIRAKELAAFFVSLSFIRLIVQVVLSIVLVRVYHQGIEGVLIANLTAVASIWLLTLIYVIKRCGISINLKLIKPILSYSIPFALSGILGVTAGNFDRYFLKEMHSMAELGIYGLALKFSLLLSLLLVEPFQRSYGPFRFSIMDDPKAEVINANIAEFLVIAAVLMSLGIALFTPTVLELVSAVEFHAASSIVPILLIGGIAAALNYCFQTGMLIHKRTQSIFRISVASSIALVVLNILLVPTYGVYGTASAYLAANVVTALLSNVSSQRLYRIPYRYLNMAGYIFLGLAIYSVATTLHFESEIYSLAARTALISCYAVAVLCINANIRSILVSYVNNRLASRIR